MKKIFLILLTIQLATTVIAQKSSINFEHLPLSESLKKAKQQNKLVFVDCYTEWCGPCKGMAATVFTQDTVAKFFNTRFINVKLDMEKGEGIAAGKKYLIEAYPSFLLLDDNGNIIYKFVGGMDANKFLAKINEGISPQNKVSVMNNRYAKGDRSPELIREYIKLKIEMMEKTAGKKIADDYFQTLTLEERAMPENWFLFGENSYTLFLSDIYSNNFNYLADNWQTFAATNGKDVVEAKLASSYLKIAGYCLRGWYFKEQPYDKSYFDRYKKQIAGTGLKDKKDLLVLIDIADAAGQKDTAKVIDLLADHVAFFSQENKRIIFDFTSMVGSRSFLVVKNPRTKEIFESIINTSTNAGLVSTVKNYQKYLMPNL